MDHLRFDDLTRSLSPAFARRGLLGGLVASALGVLSHRDGALAKGNNKGKGNKRTKCEQKCEKDCRAEQPEFTDCPARCKASCEKGAERPLDCPDGVMHCYKQMHDWVTCQYMGNLSIGSGRCWVGSDLCCAPCGTGGSDERYWNNQCNLAFPDCHNSCVASDAQEHGWSCFYNYDCENP